MNTEENNREGDSRRSARERIQEEMSEEASPLVQAITDNIKLISVVLGGIVLLVAFITGNHYYQQYAAAEAEERMEEVLDIRDPAQRIQAIQEYLPQAPHRFQQGLRMDLAETYMRLEEYGEAAETWEEIEQNSQTRHMRTIAGLGRAKALRMDDRTGEAVALLQHLRDEAPEELQRDVAFELAAAAEEREKWDLAISAYKQLRDRVEGEEQREYFYKYKISQLQDKLEEVKEEESSS